MIQKMTMPFRPFRLAMVWLLIVTVVTVGITVWWFSTIETTINYRLAWEHVWQVWLVITMAVVAAKLLPDPIDGERTVSNTRLAAIIIMVSAGSMVSYHWATQIFPGVDAFNVSKAHVSVALLLGTALAVFWSIYKIYQNHKHQQLLERRSMPEQSPPPGTFAGVE